MEEHEETRSFENGSETQKQKQEVEDEEEGEQQQLVGEENTLRFLDSLDGYLTLLDSLSSTLRQGWLEMASARYSMGASRINTALLDLKFHPAATSLQVTQHDVDSLLRQPHFTLCKWASSDGGQCCHGDAKSREDKLQTKPNSPQIRHRNNTQLSEEKTSPGNGAPLTANYQVQKERSKSLAVFGTLVSPKLRAAQLSFETALETLVEIANLRSTLLSTFDRVHKELEGTKG